jgi:hypothetical protein
VPSPFDKNKKSAAAAPAGGVATAPPAAGPADNTPAFKEPAAAGLPDAGAFAGEEGGAADDPYNASDPTGVSGYKPGHFMGQLVLCNFYETGRMVTVNSAKEEDGKSPFCKLDLIPITLPSEFGFTNKHGEYEACEPFEVGERLEELMFFNKPLVREAETAIRKKRNWVLGRITKGERRPNQDAPVILAAASAEDKAIYEAWRKTVGK